MTRVKISRIILSVLVLLSVISGIWVSFRCDRLCELNEAVRSSLEAGDKEAALEKATELGESWEDFCKWAGVMLKKDRLSEISRLASRIIPMIQADSDEAFAELDEMAELLTLLRENEAPLLTSVF